MPIPKFLLCHSAELVTEYDPDMWGNGTSTTVSLSDVRIDAQNGVSVDITRVAVQMSAMLIFDVANSLPSDVAFALPGDVIGGKRVKAQKIVWNGRGYAVKNITPCYMAGALHHYEVGLV